jgi:osmotically-inducible protein OsmY
LFDRALRHRVIEALAAAPHLDVAEIAVECREDGDVVLRGSVANLLQRAEAVRTARGVVGVHAVEDELRTRPVGPRQRVDARTEAAVLDALILHGADLEVDGGTVTLCGGVDSPGQREVAGRIAARVPGVSEVRNRLEPLDAYANPAGSERGDSTRPSWLRDVMSSLLKTLRRW